MLRVTFFPKQALVCFLINENLFLFYYNVKPGAPELNRPLLHANGRIVFRIVKRK